MSRLKRARRIVLLLTVLVVMAVVAVGILAIGVVRQSFPETSGQLAIEGLTSSVSVHRDAQGVPSIYADNASDLFRAQGFVSAQDRFFEMDLRRHVTAGRLSELVGSAGIDSDKVIRTMGWRRVAEQELPTLAPETRQYLQAYADGVNAYIKKAGSPEKMSLEYTVLARRNPGYRVEPWTPVDSLAWLKAMAWDLRGDYKDELARARLSRTTRSVKQVEPALPALSRRPQPADPLAAGLAAGVGADRPGGEPRAGGPDGDAHRDGGRCRRLGPRLGRRGPGHSRPRRRHRLQLVGRRRAARTTTGKPLLANDPHLGLAIPGIWGQVNLQCRTLSAACPFRVSGFTFSGLPGVVIGHNDKVAWGMTNLSPDVTDFYLEQVSGRLVPA